MFTFCPAALSQSYTRADSYSATSNSGGNNILNADTLIIDDNKKLILQLEKDLELVRTDMEKRLADKDKIIALL